MSSESLVFPTRPRASILVLKPRITLEAAKQSAEAGKLPLFPTVKKSLFGPKPEEIIQVQAVEKDYQDYIRVRGFYSVKYIKRNTYMIQVDANVTEVTCGNASFKPADKTVKFEVDERKIYSNEMTLLYNADAKQAKPEIIPQADAEENPFLALSEAKIDVKQFDSLEETVFNNAIDVLKLLLCRTSDQMDKSEEERLDLREFTHIFIPHYKTTIKNVKTGEAKSITIDGMTGSTLLSGA